MDSCAEIECPFSGVTRSGRVWRRVPGVMLEVFSVQRRCLLFPVAIVSTVCACSSLRCQQSALVPRYVVNSLPLFLVTLSTVCPCSSLHCSSLRCQQSAFVPRYTLKSLALFFVTLLTVPLFLVTLSIVCPCSSLNCQQFGLVLRYIVNSLPLFLVTLSTVCPCSSLQWTKAKSLSRLWP